MKRILAFSVVVLVGLAGCRTTDVDTATVEGTEVTTTIPTASAVPAGTALNVRLNETLSTEASDVGDTFSATVVNDLRAATGEIAVPAGATMYGTITGLDASDHVGDQAAIRLAFDRFVVNGVSHDFSADVVEARVEQRRDRDIDLTSRETAVGAAAGAALGAIVGGDLLDILIGGALGAGAGTVISLGTGDVEAEIPAGSVLTVRTTEQIALR